jgi:hypothetical protein
MADNVFPQHGDAPDAANFAALAGTQTASSHLASGLGFTVDYATPALDVDAGTAFIVAPSMETASPDIDPPETRQSAGVVVETDAKIALALTDGATNHVFLDANLGTDDAPEVVVNTTGDAPSEASLKLGEVDTANDAKSDQWYLAAEDGTLTFPDKAAADAASAALRVGTVVYDRAGNSHYYVTE